MSPPSVRINTFVEENKIVHVDPISKMFIITEVIFGLDRLPLIGKGKFVYVCLTFLIFLALNITTLYMAITNAPDINTMALSQMTQNIICTILSYTRCKWMLSFYSELNKFDSEAGCRPKISISSVRNVVQAGLTCIFIVVLFTMPAEIGIQASSPYHYISMHIVYILEIHYFGHLLSLLIPRLKLINYQIESSLASAKSELDSILNDFVNIKRNDTLTSQYPMRKLMDLYQMIVESYDAMIEGIKWQLLLMITTAFMAVLGFLFSISLSAMKSGEIFVTSSTIFPAGITLVLMAPLFAPCMYGDSVHNEVKKLRELLASRLYENKLDKTGRSVARALLALTETRDLSFRLLRMLNIDISLPFKFAGLLVTYLIILLQFEKVINP